MLNSYLQLVVVLLVFYILLLYTLLDIGQR